MIFALAFVASAAAQTTLSHGYVLYERAGNASDVNAVACAGPHAFMRSWSGHTAHWDGSDWTSVGAPEGQAYGRSIAATADGRAFVTASARIAEWNGSAWIDHAMEPGTGELTGMWGPNASQIFVAGRGRLAMLSGSGFRSYDAGTWRDLSDVWGTSASDLWLAGQGGTVMRRTARGFRREATHSDAWLRGIWGTGASDVWVWAYEYQGGSTILHFDGSGWTRVDTSNLAGELRAVGGAPRLVYAVGDFGIARFDGQSRFVVDLTPEQMGPGYHRPIDVCATDRHLVVGDGSGHAVIRPL
jgi:hypothetical protein